MHTQVVSTLNANSGYCRHEVDKEDRDEIVSTSHDASYLTVVILLGFINAPYATMSDRRSRVNSRVAI